MRAPITFYFLCSLSAFGQLNQPLAVQTCAGGRATTADLTTVTAAGQPIAGISRNGQLVNYAGFIQTTALKPLLTKIQPDVTP
jgi:hypothetical protein